MILIEFNKAKILILLSYYSQAQKSIKIRA